MSRLELHDKLLEILPNVYFQPPSNIILKYPCIVYNKTPKYKRFANGGVYFSKQGYQLTVIENNPDSEVADVIESRFPHCAINQYFTKDNLNHTTLNLYY